MSTLNGHLCILRSRLPIFTCYARTIKTGKETKQPTAISTKVKIDTEETEDATPGVVEPPSQPSMPDRPRERPYSKIPRVPRKPQLSRTEDLDKIIESWHRQLPHDEDPAAMEDMPVRNHYEEMKYLAENSPSFKLIPTDKLIRLQKRYDWSWGAFIRWIEAKALARERRDQSFNRMRHGILGPDLAAAHFITNRMGRVKFCGHAEWFSFETSDKLPAKYEDNWLIEKIDATGLKMIYEGMDNLVNLFHLTDLNLTNSTELDVWAFDKLFRMYRFSTKLTRLNVTNCSRFCENSLMSCHRIPSLQEVIITGTRASEYGHLKLLVHELQDIRPNMRVIV